MAQLSPRPEGRSLQTRLLLLVLGLVTLVWCGSAVVVWRDARHELDELLDGHLAQAAALLIMQQSQLQDDEELGDAPALHKYAPRVAFQVFHEGQLSLRSANVGAQALSPRKEGFETVQRDGATWRVFAARGAEHDVQVYVAERTEARNAILLAVLRGSLMPLLWALPLLALLLWWAVRQGLSPLRELSQMLRQRPADAMQSLDLPQAPAEVVPVVASLNALLGRIAALLESERRFTADAAHELRTPIAGIRMQAQVALGAGSDQPQREQALQATLAGCDRATRLVEQLLTLSRLDATPAASRQSVALGPLARQVAAELAPVALARQQELVLDSDADLAVPGDETLLRVLLRNLLDNALRYSPDGAKVRVSLSTHDDGLTLCVQDSGPGMSEADLARLGERFFRVLGSGQPGSGLGWSIVRRIASAHGATLQARRSQALGGLEVLVTWPASAGHT